MKLINQSAKVWGNCPSTLEETILWIERAGRVCYRSEDNIVEGSGRKFVDNIIKRGHTSVLEHSNIVCRTVDTHKFPKEKELEIIGAIDSKFINTCVRDNRVYMGGNLRAWMECFRIGIDDIYGLLIEDSIELVAEDIPVELQRKTIEFITDRAVSHELVRHRAASFSQESQRYVGYSEMEFIRPSWFKNAEEHVKVAFKISCKECSDNYKWLRRHLKPEHTRTVLTNQVATKIIVTATIPQWGDIFKLRCSQAAYPQIRELMNMVKGKVLDAN